MLYSEKVMDHFRNPRNLGKMEDADGVGEVGNAKCGDIMKIYIKVENDIITDVSFNTFGCGSAIASRENPSVRRWNSPTELSRRRWTGSRPIRCTARCWRRRRSGRQ